MKSPLKSAAAMAAVALVSGFLQSGHAYGGIFGIGNWESSIKEFQEHFSRELNRRVEVCGERYANDIDSASDYDQEPSPWFPARVKVLADPQEAFLAKLMGIRQAKCEIWVSTYIFQAAPTTQTLLDELRMAIEERGVNVRFTIDSTGSLMGTFDPKNPLHSDAKAILFSKRGTNACTGKPASVDVALFNSALKPKNWLDAIAAKITGKEDSTLVNPNHRSHDKIFLVDPQDPEISLAIVGGRNWTDSYYGMPQPDSKTYEDMEVLVRDSKNPSEVRLKDTVGFHHKRLLCHKGNRWLFTTGAKNRLAEFHSGKNGHEAMMSRPNVQALLARMSSKTDPNAFINTGLTEATVKWGNEIENVRRPYDDTVVDPDRLPPVTKNGDSIVDNSHELIGAAKKQIDLVSPYLYLSTKEREELKAWVLADPSRKVTIISNSAATSDGPPAQEMVDHDVAPDFMNDERIQGVAHPQLTFFELGRLDGDKFGGKAFYGKLHAKFWTIDHEISFVGSHNFDPRSRYFNSEVGFFVKSPVVAAALEKKVVDTTNRSYVWGSADWKALNARPEIKKMKTEEKYVETAFDKLPSLKSQF
jgi:putative cardiolipin synthase